jgi:integrase
MFYLTVRASTPDKIPTKAQLRSILNYMDIKGRAIILFLASTGCRIGETLRLKKIDLKLRARERIYQELIDRQW